MMQQPDEFPKTFGFNKANVKTILYSLPVFTLAGLFFIINGLSRNNPRDTVGFIVGGVVFLVITAGLFAASHLIRRVEAIVDRDGLTVTNMLGQISQCRWDEIDEVYELIAYSQRGFANDWVYTIHLKNGHKLKLTKSFEKIQSLGHILQKAVGERLLPKTEQEYSKGNTVRFGPKLSLSQQGITCQGQTLPWDQAGEINITRSGDINIRETNKYTAWKVIMHAHIANFPILRYMLHKASEQYPINVNDPIVERNRNITHVGPETGAGTIGDLSTRLGMDVRELMMQGHDLQSIYKVVNKEMTLEELLKQKPRKSKR